MDVSMGLISKLVKCRSVERALAPIASQVSMLMILMDQTKDAKSPTQRSTPAGNGINVIRTGSTDSSGVLSVSSCATKMATAVSHVISLGERESRNSSDQVFTSHMTSACETLDLANTNLFVTAQQFEIEPAYPGTRNALCQAAKDVLQAVLKVLLVVDDEKVSRIVSLIDQVQNKLGAVGVVDRTDQLVPSFRDLTDSIMKLKAQIDSRKEDLCSEACREQLGVCFSVLRKCIPSLSMALQTFLKYKSNATAQASRDLVLQQMWTALREMRTIIQSGALSSKEDDKQGSFVSHIDKVMSFLAEEQRLQLSVDFESALVASVGHSLSVSHFSSGSLRELIISSCHRILQAKFRLLDLNKARIATPNISNIEEEYNSICETILDEACDLEKHVNMTLLHLIVDTFLETSVPLDKLVKAALGFKSKGRLFTHVHGGLMTIFTEHSDYVCNVALLIAASSTDLASVSDIRSSVQCLESIDPDIIPAVVTVANEPSKMASVRHLRLLVKRWQIEMDTTLRAIDRIVDPYVFLDVTEHKLSEEMATMRVADIPLMESASLKSKVHHCLCLSERSAQLGTRLVDRNADPIYRNGLRVFVNKVTDAVALARAAASDVIANSPSSKLVDTMDRRLKLLQGSVTDLRQGLNARHHPHILSQERDLTRQRAGQFLSHHAQLREQPIVENGSRQQNDAAITSTSSSFLLPSQQVSASNSKLKQTTERKLRSIDDGDGGYDNDNDNDNDKRAYTSSSKDGKLVAAETVTVVPSRTSGVGNVCSWPASPHMDEIVMASKPPTEMVEAVMKEDSKEQPSSIQLLVSRLLTAATEGDRICTDNLTSDLLGWTNHIVDAGQHLVSHCKDIYKKEELGKILREVDELAPQVIQRSKFMVSGDKEGRDELFVHANEWGAKLEKARVIVDVASDRWLLLTDALGQAMQTGDEIQVRKVLASINLAQQEMSRLLLKTRYLSGRMVEGGAQSMSFLGDSLKDGENLAITISTSVDVTAVSATRTASDKWQLVQVCRDWSVLMTCVLAEMDRISNAMEELGRRKFPSLLAKQRSTNPRLCDVLEEETNHLLELVDCVVSGDVTLKNKSEALVMEVNEALSDIVALSSQNVVSSNIPQHILFSRLRIGLTRCRWLEKAFEIRDVIHQNTFELSGCVRHVLHTILDVRETGTTPDLLMREEQRLSNAFLDVSRNLKQKALAAVQLSSDLPRRAVIRFILDRLSDLTSRIHAQIKDPDLTESDVDYLSEQWGARVRKLIVHLNKLEPIRPGTVSEIEKLTKMRIAPGQVKEGNSPTSKFRLEQRVHKPGRNLGDPSTDSHFQSISQPSQCGLQHQPSSPLTNSVSLLLRGAEFLDSKVTEWDQTEVGGATYNSLEGNADVETPWNIAYHARAMAKLSSNMALYTKGQGPFKSSEDVVQAAVTMTDHSAALEQLGQTLAGLVLDSRCATDLKASVTRMNSMTSQQHIIATALHNSAHSFEGDRMLVRNASNLLGAVRDLLARMESVAVLDLREPDVVDEKMKSILSLLSRVGKENGHYLQTERSEAELDELGLRRVERHNPPTLTSLVRL